MLAMNIANIVPKKMQFVIFGTMKSCDCVSQFAVNRFLSQLRSARQCLSDKDRYHS